MTYFKWVITNLKLWNNKNKYISYILIYIAFNQSKSSNKLCEIIISIKGESTIVPTITLTTTGIYETYEQLTFLI